MEIQIRTKHKNIIDSLTENELPNGMSISVLPISERRAFGSEEILIAIVSVGPGIIASLVANWLWDKLKNKTDTKIYIDYKEVTLKKESITEVIEKKLTIKYELKG